MAALLMLNSREYLKANWSDCCRPQFRQIIRQLIAVGIFFNTGWSAVGLLNRDALARWSGSCCRRKLFGLPFIAIIANEKGIVASCSTVPL